MMLRFLFFFSLLFSIFSYACAQSVNNDFYLGLNSANTRTAVTHYEKALTSKNVYIRRAAAQELAVLMNKGNTLPLKTIQKVKNEIHGTWKSAYDSVSFRNRSEVNKDKPLNFLLNLERDTTGQNITEEVRRFVLRESGKNSINFDNLEMAGINGHFHAAHFRYREALAYFRGFMNESAEGSKEWPMHLPGIFLKYPVLINDLGRAFQYTSSGLEGMNLFLQWERNLITAESYDSLKEARYRLLFYAARIARRNGRSEQALNLFEKVLPDAPAPEQTDACIWYILDLAKTIKDDLFLEKLEQYVNNWQDKNYYYDILEKNLQTLAEKKDWDGIINTYNIIKESGAPIVSAYGFVIARIIEEEYKTAVQLNDKTEYLTAAYNASAGNFYSMLYYRVLCAESLNKPLFPAELTDTGKKTADSNTAPVLQFISGFFTYNAQGYALRYIRQLENENAFSIEELRACADLLETAEMYADAIRLVSRYMNREDYTIKRRDIEMLFPQPFKTITEKYAQITNIPPEILFGLIRTESAFQSTIVSRSNAVGLTQLIPATAEEMANRIRRAGGPDYSGENLNLDDPEQNVHIGAYYLGYLMERFNDMLIALMAYNGGMNRIRRFMQGNSLPSDLFMETVNITETRDYGRKVLGTAAVYRELYYQP